MGCATPWTPPNGASSSRMWTMIARRTLQSVPVLVGISIITFVLIYYLPADPARMYAGPSATAETVLRIRHELGLDQPLWVQYFSYLGRMLHGDLGFSYRKQVAVTQLILGRVPFTAALTLGGIFVELAIGLPVGIISAVGRGHWAAGWLVDLGVGFPSLAQARADYRVTGNPIVIMQRLSPAVRRGAFSCGLQGGTHVFGTVFAQVVILSGTPRSLALLARSFASTLRMTGCQK